VQVLATPKDPAHGVQQRLVSSSASRGSRQPRFGPSSTARRSRLDARCASRSSAPRWRLWPAYRAWCGAERVGSSRRLRLV